MTNATKQQKLTAKLENVAREQVNLWIEQGLMTADMKDKSAEVVAAFQSLIHRDIRTFAETGKYPQYA
jgi:hypothetical protein